MKPEVSVILPVHNEERYLPSAMKSLADQTFTRFELVVVDDESSDRSMEIVAGFAGALRIRILPNESTRGIAGALNTGLKHARAPLIARQDADDVSLPRRLQSQVGFMERNPHVACAGTRATLIDKNGEPIGPNHLPRDRPVPCSDGELQQILPWICPFTHGSMMMRRTTIEDAGGYRVPFVFAEDYDLWLRVSGTATLANLPESLYLYRRHDDSMWGSKWKAGKVFAQVAQSLARERFYRGTDILMDAGVEAFWDRYGSAFRNVLSDAEMAYLDERMDEPRLGAHAPAT
ncbi:glycosyltransferase family 2 protein [Kribbella sp. DT2]|uniref:glycosyltransferase family 2 protein n=1 Tax=Kribbella sp. DT2 TaxID=3393427 RepID=UPI003CF5217A